MLIGKGKRNGSLVSGESVWGHGLALPLLLNIVMVLLYSCEQSMDFCWGIGLHAQSITLDI